MVGNFCDFAFVVFGVFDLDLNFLNGIAIGPNSVVGGLEADETSIVVVTKDLLARGRIS